MFDWTVVVPTFLAATVEWVEAFTIVLAVSLTIGWRAAVGAAATALMVLAAMTAATGGVLRLGLSIHWLQLSIGVFLLLFGVRWLAKAIARQAGLTALRDEAEEFERTRGRLASGDWYAGWAIAFKGVLLEGLEVWLIVVALGVDGAWASSAGAAIAALIPVATAGLLVQAPLARVPENAIKFAVGTMIVSFGTFWTLEALGGPTVWPAGDWSLPGLVIFYGGGGAILAALLRRPAQWREVR
jgi:Ca2+/H+ antiporter, TMEM165/GDT1 family